MAAVVVGHFSHSRKYLSQNIISTSIWFPLILFPFKFLLFIKLSIVRFNVGSGVRSVSFVYRKNGIVVV